MIEFNGTLSDKCKQYMLKKEIHKLFAIIMSIPLFALIIFFSVTWHWSMLLALPCVVFYVILLCMPPRKSSYGLIFPSLIQIKDSGEMYVTGEKFYCKQSISQVKLVEDHGEWYHIVFRYPYTNPRFVCQKNLLTKGTIEEFERIFEGKIIRNVTTQP